MTQKSENTEIEDDTYEDWQFEYSVKQASEFLEENILTELEEFDYCNEDPDYIIGTATLALFCEMVARLGVLGYTEDDLIDEIKTHIDMANIQMLQ